MLVLTMHGLLLIRPSPKTKFGDLGGSCKEYNAKEKWASIANSLSSHVNRCSIFGRFDIFQKIDIFAHVIVCFTRLQI